MTVLKDAPSAFRAYSPENFDGRFVGPLTAKDALIRSRNVPAVYVAEQLPQPALYGFLERAGVSGLRSREYYGLALVLGGGSLTMGELVSLYGALANRGVVRPVRYRAEQGAPAGVRLLSAEASYVTRSEEHTSELQSLAYLVCRLLLEKKKKRIATHYVGAAE